MRQVISKKEFIKMYLDKNVSIVEMSKKLNISRVWIYNLANRLGLPKSHRKKSSDFKIVD